MSELRSLLTLLDHEERLRDEVQARLRQAQARVGQAQAQHEQLDSYQGEYRQRWGTRFATQATDAALLQHYTGFGDRLGQAITQQAQVVQSAQAQAERVRQALVAQETRVAAVRKLIERRQAQAQLAQARREQKQIDEAAARAGMAQAWLRPEGGF